MEPLAFLTPLEAWRQQKDEYLTSSRNSPFYGGTDFAGLDYFPEDEAARVVARLERAAEQRPIILATSSGEERLFIEFGTATFELGGQSVALTLFASTDSPHGPRLFLPFADATSGRETYGAGRYLDPHLSPDAADELVLDFNYAYHPYCAYAEGYVCPFPPAGNRLPVVVRAGERLAPQDLDDDAG